MLTASAVVLLGLLGLVAIFVLLEELDEDSSAYGLREAAWYVLLTLPRRAYELLPYVLFLGSLISLGTLASQSELVAMRMAGVSVYRLLGGLAWAVGLAWMLGLVVGEWAAPEREILAEAHKVQVMSGIDHIEFRGGHWHREGSLYMHIEGLDANGDLLGVRQYWLNDNNEPSLTRMAARAEHQGGEGPDEHWILHDGAQTWLKDGRVVVEEFQQLSWRGRLDPKLLGERILIDPRKASLFSLRGQISYLERQGLDATDYAVVFWSKSLQPAAVLGLVALALAFVLGPLREVGIGVRITAGVIVGLCFKYLQDLFVPMSTLYELPPPLAVGAPIFLCWALAIWGIRRNA